MPTRNKQHFSTNATIFKKKKKMIAHKKLKKKKDPQKLIKNKSSENTLPKCGL